MERSIDLPDSKNERKFFSLLTSKTRSWLIDDNDYILSIRATVDLFVVDEWTTVNHEMISPDVLNYRKEGGERKREKERRNKEAWYLVNVGHSTFALIDETTIVRLGDTFRRKERLKKKR